MRWLPLDLIDCIDYKSTSICPTFKNQKHLLFSHEMSSLLLIFSIWEPYNSPSTNSFTIVHNIHVYVYCIHLFIYYIPLHYLPTIISTTFTKKLPLFYTASCVLCVFIPKMLFICMNKSLVSEFHISTSTMENKLFLILCAATVYILVYVYTYTTHTIEQTVFFRRNIQKHFTRQV